MTFLVTRNRFNYCEVIWNLLWTVSPWNLVGRKIICTATEDDVGCNTIGVPLNSFNVIFVNDFDQTVY